MPSFTGPLYRLYAWRLVREIRRRPVPGHVGIILDGNRRYAREHRLADPELAYSLGAEKLDDVLAWCVAVGIPTLSLWVLSTDNLLRPPRELAGIFAAIETKLGRLVEDRRIRRHAVRVRAVGKLELLPDSTLAAVRAAEAATADQRGMTLLIAVAYGGREEIADAVRDMLRDKLKQAEELPALIESISQAEIARYLYAPDVPDPDLIIRTSGAIRLSGFMLWQSAYSEFYFCDAPWPAFRKVDFLRAVRAYQQRQRRFGR